MYNSEHPTKNKYFEFSRQTGIKGTKTHRKNIGVAFKKSFFAQKERANSISPVTFDYIGKVFLLYRLLTFHSSRSAAGATVL